MTANELFKYTAFLRIAMTQARRARGELYGRAVFFAVILGVFASLWKAVAETGMPLGMESRALVWYLAITEWIVLSAPPMQIEVQEAIRRGDIVCQLARPVSWVGATFAEGLGLLLVRAPLLFVTACLCAWVMTGWVPALPVLLLVLPVGLAAGALITALQIGIGVLAFWIGDVGPVSWVWQKLMFLFGGLLMPIDLYPPVVRGIAPFTPFPSVLTEPASLVLHGTLEGVLPVVGHLAMWSVISAAMISVLFSRASASLTVNGG
jgi:ABC-2 type transport system permease protein